MTSKQAIQDELTRYRRELHKIPETGKILPVTCAYLKEILRPLLCEIEDVGDSGFVCVFRASAVGTCEEAGAAIAFRTDMDALPVIETTGFDFASQHEGNMHACGHDGHMAIMLGFAHRVAEARDEGRLSSDVVLVFQSGEEGYAGAREFMQTGVLERHGVSRIYGLHLWPGREKGSIVSRCKEFMASSMVCSIDIHGRSAHVGRYKDGADALEAAAYFVHTAYEKEKTIPADIRRLLRFGILRSGSAANVVSDAAHIEGTLRSYDMAVSDELWNMLAGIAQEAESQYGVRFEMSHTAAYPPVTNDPALYEVTRQQLQAAGFSWHDLDEPILMAEDFACYQEKLPGIFMHLMTGLDLSLHRGDYTIAEECLPIGVKIFETLLGI